MRTWREVQEDIGIHDVGGEDLGGGVRGGLVRQHIGHRDVLRVHLPGQQPHPPLMHLRRASNHSFTKLDLLNIMEGLRA